VRKKFTLVEKKVYCYLYYFRAKYLETSPEAEKLTSERRYRWR